MLKIAIFYDKPINPKGGIQTYCIRLKKLLEQNGQYKVSLFPNISYKMLYRFRFYSKKEIINALLSDDFDYIHINGFISSLPMQIYKQVKSLKLTAPIIYTPHANPFKTLNHPIINKCFFYVYVKKVLKKAYKLVSINAEDCQFFKKFNKNVVTISHWLESIPQILQESKQSGGKKKILYVGRNDVNKNLKALYGIPQNKYEVTCITDSKPSREDFKFLPMNFSEADLYEFYNNSDLTVIPSHYESFCYVALESLCCGTPILISNKVRIADFLDGINGVTTYNYEDDSELINKIDYALAQKVDVEKIIERFSAEAAFEKYSNQVFTK